MLDASQFSAMAMERPALARTPDGRWRLWTCAATPGSAHWWIDVLEADTVEALADATPRPAFPGDSEIGAKDPVVRLSDHRIWHAWICCHLLDVPGQGHELRTDFVID